MVIASDHLLLESLDLLREEIVVRLELKVGESKLGPIVLEAGCGPTWLLLEHAYLSREQTVLVSQLHELLLQGRSQLLREAQFFMVGKDLLVQL